MNDSAAQSHSSQYCSDLVRERDEDRWLAAGYAPPLLQRKLLALYAFHAELRRIPSAVSEPPLGEIRLQWWREALDEIRAGKPPRAHPVVEEIAFAGLARPEYAALLAEAIEANARPLYGEPFSSLDALERWLGEADGAVDAVATLLAAEDRALAEAARRAGTGFALAREGRALAPHLEGDIRKRSVELAGETAADMKRASASAAPALLHLSLTKTYARRKGTPFPLAKRLKLFSAMAFKAF